jgi:hypothetical protein
MECDMEREHTSGVTGVDMMENGMRITLKDMVCLRFRMGKYIVANFSVTRPVERESLSVMMDRFTTESGEIALRKVKVAKYSETGKNIQECGAKAKKTAMDNYYSKMEVIIKVIFRIMNCKVMDNMSGKAKKNILEIGSIIRNAAKVVCYGKTEKNMMASSFMTKCMGKVVF